MQNEIELKLSVPDNAEAVILEALVPQLAATVNTYKVQLFNQYFDTSDNILRNNRIGFRVRGADGRFEQTVKTAGTSLGGLHQRPEHNVSLNDNQPDLSLFPAHIWPQKMDVVQVQSQLQCLFTTHFLRTVFELNLDNGCEVELVFDLGKVSRGEQHDKICEIELELKKGEPQELFEIADKTARIMPVKIGNLSKAARGYMLVNGDTPQRAESPSVLPLALNSSVEQGFCQALEYALFHWQQNELCYATYGRSKDLLQSIHGMKLALNTLTLYLPALQCEDLLTIHNEVQNLLHAWQWLDEFSRLVALQSKRSPYIRTLQRNEEFLSYLRGRTKGMLVEYQPEKLMSESAYILVQLSLSRLLVERPWRKTQQSAQIELSDRARGWLSQAWQLSLHTFRSTHEFSLNTYLASQSELQHTLFYGFSLASMLEERQEEYIAPWQNMLEGVEELAFLNQMHNELLHCELENKEELLQWSQTKINSLLGIMEQSRLSVIKLDEVW